MNYNAKFSDFMNNFIFLILFIIRKNNNSSLKVFPVDNMFMFMCDIR